MASNTGAGGSGTDFIKRAGRLRQKKHREADRLFLAEGANLVREATGSPVRLFTGPEEIKKLSTLSTPTGPVGVFPFLDVAAGDLLAKAPRVLLLYGVQDPGNVGTAIRSAHAFGAGVALAAGCADLYNPKTVRATMGSIFHAPVARELNTPEFLGLARKAGFTSVAATPEGGEAPRSMPMGKTIILVGAEGSGLPEEVAGACDFRATIPARAASLNAAVAASILLYEAHNRMLL